MTDTVSLTGEALHLAARAAVLAHYPSAYPAYLAPMYALQIGATEYGWLIRTMAPHFRALTPCRYASASEAWISAAAWIAAAQHVRTAA